MFGCQERMLQLIGWFIAADGVCMRSSHLAVTGGEAGIME
jgi:hypothetical protein